MAAVCPAPAGLSRTHRPRCAVASRRGTPAGLRGLWRPARARAVGRVVAYRPAPIARVRRCFPAGDAGRLRGLWRPA
ncbi:hypothetical protein ABZ891_24005, partial [Streptomyces sp. NPDC047023]|uniref:hypothetical protein n=1 Tax=Streptomyces sp. NPDC047023 TaxID=3155139 RepID=UPI0033C13429